MFTESGELCLNRIPYQLLFSLQSSTTSKKVLDLDEDDDAKDKIRRRPRVSEAGETVISSSDEEGKVGKSRISRVVGRAEKKSYVNVYHNLVFIQATDSGIATSGDPSPVSEAEREKRLPEPQVRLEMFSPSHKTKRFHVKTIAQPTAYILLSVAEERAEEGGGRWCEGEQVVQPV